jgi:hypothetical protein
MIKKHEFFSGIDWEKLKSKMVKAPYRPVLKNEYDTSHFDLK